MNKNFLQALNFDILPKFKNFRACESSEKF